MPYSVEPWLREHPDKLRQVLEDLRDAATFLRERGIVHFDANFDNVLSDGEHAYLTDFGLVLDERFELAPDEASFLKQGAEYDYAEILGSVGFFLSSIYESLPDTEKHSLMERYGLTKEMHLGALVSILLDNIEALAAEGALTLDQELLATLVKYRSVIKLFLDFFASMRRNKRKDTPFPYPKLTQLLEETGFLAGSV
jgi:serine/threonine protein kinase